MCGKILNIFQKFQKIHKFLDFSEVFRIIFFCTVSCSNVIHIIRFDIKYQIGVSICGHGGRWEKMVLYKKPPKIVILRGLNRVGSLKIK